MGDGSTCSRGSRCYQLLLLIPWHHPYTILLLLSSCVPSCVCSGCRVLFIWAASKTAGQYCSSRSISRASGSSVVVMGGVWWAVRCLCGPLVTVGLRQMSCFKGRPIRWAAFGVKLGRSSRRAVCWLSVGQLTPTRDPEILFISAAAAAAPDF